MNLKSISMFMLLVCVALTVHGLRKDIHPPVWEYTYTFELFEKIYQQTQDLRGEMRRMTNELFYRCPKHWKEGMDGSCYFVPFYKKLDWFSAQECCERLGGHLAIIGSEKEDKFVSEYLVNLQTNETYLDLTYIWIGGFDFHQEGDWSWVNGEEFLYQNWRIPVEQVTNDNANTEDCLDWSNGWNDNKCTNRYYFLCEKS